MSHTMFFARVLMVWSPSSSHSTSSGHDPWTWFQYCDDTTGMLHIVKYLFRRSNAAVAPPLLHETTHAPTFPLIFLEYV